MNDRGEISNRTTNKSHWFEFVIWVIIGVIILLGLYIVYQPSATNYYMRARNYYQINGRFLAKDSNYDTWNRWINSHSATKEKWNIDNRQTIEITGGASSYNLRLLNKKIDEKPTGKFIFDSLHWGGIILSDTGNSQYSTLKFNAMGEHEIRVCYWADDIPVEKANSIGHGKEQDETKISDTSENWGYLLLSLFYLPCDLTSNNSVSQNTKNGVTIKSPGEIADTVHLVTGDTSISQGVDSITEKRLVPSMFFLDTFDYLQTDICTGSPLWTMQYSSNHLYSKEYDTLSGKEHLKLKIKRKIKGGFKRYQVASDTSLTINNQVLTDKIIAITVSYTENYRHKNDTTLYYHAIFHVDSFVVILDTFLVSHSMSMDSEYTAKAKAHILTSPKNISGLLLDANFCNTSVDTFCIIKPERKSNELIVQDSITWNWQIKPIRKGKTTVLFTITAFVMHEIFGKSKKDLIDQRQDVCIIGSNWHESKLFLSKYWGIFLAAFVGAIGVATLPFVKKIPNYIISKKQSKTKSEIGFKRNNQEDKDKPTA